MAEDVSRGCLQIFLLLLLCNGLQCRRLRFRDCIDERLKESEDAADVVITGTVKRLHKVHSPLYNGEVQVKRVIKGDYIKVGETLLVEGFGQKDLCSSQVRNKDSKIFLLTQLHTGSFKLNSSVLHVNAPNLDRITAAVKEEPYRRKPHIQDDICEKKYCQFNGDCFVENLRGVCRCGTSCQESSRSICASDGITYQTECQMRVDSCRKKQRVYHKHDGICLRRS